MLGGYLRVRPSYGICCVLRGYMKRELSRKVKITIGIVAFVIVMVAIAWVVALALLYTDIKTEVYGAEFDYVDNVMYDNTYIAMRGGRWQLYRDGGAVSRTFGSLDYVEDEGRFAFINTDGKGWGYVDTSGAIIVEYTQEYRRLLPEASSLVAVRVGENDFAVRNGENRNFRESGTPVLIEEFPAFYRAYGDKYVVYKDETGKYMAVDTVKYEKKELPFDINQSFVASDGFLTVEGERPVTYDSQLMREEYLDGYMPAEKNGDGYIVVGSHAVLRKSDGSSVVYTLESGKSFIAPSSSNIELTDGTVAVINRGDGEHSFFNGNSISVLRKRYEAEILGGNVHVFFKHSDGNYIAFDDKCNRVEAIQMEVVTLCREKEKNRAQYTVEVDFLLADGKIYAYENEELKPRLENVTAVVSNDERTASRIVTQSKENGTVIYDSFFEVTDRKNKMASAEVIDPFIPVYAEIKEGKKAVTMPRGTFETEKDASIVIVKCTDDENYYAAVKADEEGTEYKFYAKNGSFAGEYVQREEDKTIVSETQIVVYGKDEINFVTKSKKLKIKYDKIYFGLKNKYAVTVDEGVMNIVNLNDGNITETRYISNPIEIVERGRDTFTFRDTESELYGIIRDGRVTLSPAFRQMKLHDGFVIASVDGEEESGQSFFQADFSGGRISDVYYELESTEGLTMGMTNLGEREIMNARGRVILKHVTFVPYREDGGFDFMESYVYDEETGRTVSAERKDSSRLLTVTAGGSKRVISITREER